MSLIKFDNCAYLEKRYYAIHYGLNFKFLSKSMRSNTISNTWTHLDCKSALSFHRSVRFSSVSLIDVYEG